MLQSGWGNCDRKAKPYVIQYVWYLWQKIKADPSRHVNFRAIRCIGCLLIAGP
jgi:hypothetical protein